MAQELCPYCGAPGSVRESVDGTCYVCGMVLPSAGEASVAEEADLAQTEGPVAPAATESDRPKAPSASSSAPTILHDGSDIPAISLIQPRNLSPEYARRVTAAWQGTSSSYKNHQETLNSSSSKAAGAENLNIGTRSLTDVNDPRQADYQLTEVIGEGNMGTVWSARQASLDRDVAVKIPKRSTHGTIGREQFISEVVVTGQLDHPNIVPIYDLARDESGQLFYSMKRVEGRSWDQIIHEPGRTRQENVEVLMKVCDAIRFAHDRGVIHRDIKPQNIMVGKYGEVSVMDWGIALRLDSLNVSTGVTRLSPAGTPAYMAPEMATANPGEIGPHTDVYLLGAVLFEIITGEPPHPPPIDSEDRLVQQNACLLIAARNVITATNETGELIDIAFRAMATDIYKRYQTVEEFQNAIREYLSHTESIALAERGQEHLAHALEQQNGVYEDYAKARFAFGEAIELWPENTKARQGLEQATIAYAGAALDRGDHALGLSLLSSENPEHAGLIRKLQAAKRRADRNRNMAIASAAAAACFLIIGIGVSSVFAVRESVAKKNAIAAQNEAVLARNDEAEQRRLAQEREKDANEQRQRAEGLYNDLQKSNAQLADAYTDIQETNRKLENQIEETLIARTRAESASYQSEIGLAAEEVRRNAFNSARAILEKQSQNDAQAQFRNWEWGHLMALARDPSIADFHMDGMPRVEAVAISPDQKWVAAGTDDGDVHVWWHPDPQEPPRQLPSRTKEHAGPVTGVAISPDNRLLVSVGTFVDEQNQTRSEIRFWELPEGEADLSLKSTGTPIQYSSRILSIQFSPDASTVLTSAANSTAQLWSRTRTDQLVRTFVGHLSGPVWQARFSTDGAQVATAGDDGSVRIWDARTGSETRRFEGHRGPVYSVEFAPQGNYVVSGGRDRRVLVWQLQSPDVARNRVDLIKARLASIDTVDTTDADRLGEHAAAVRCLSFSPDGSTLFTASHDNSVGVWDMSQGPAAGQLRKMLRGHGGWVRSCAATADGQHVLSGSYDGRVYLWDWAKYAMPRVLRPASELTLSDLRFTSVAASSNARWIATAAENGAITVWDMRDPLNPTAQQLSEGHDWQATTGAYFRNGTRLLTGGGDNRTVVWDTNRGSQLLRIGGWNTPGGSGWRGIAAASRQGNWIATGSDDDRVLARLWDAETGQLITSFATALEDADLAGQDERSEATAIAFSPDDQTLFVGDQWGNCFLFSSRDGSLKRSFRGHDGKITAAAYLPDGRLLTASSDGSVSNWRLDDAQQDAALERQYAHLARVVSLDVAEDGKRFATVADPEDTEAVLRLWDTDSGELLRHLTLDQLTGTRRADRAPAERLPAVRSVALHRNRQQALVTVFDPQTSQYQVGTWDWDRGEYRRESSGLRDTSMAIYAPNQDGAILTVGGRGARLRLANQVVRSYRPQPGVQSISFSPSNQLLAAAGNDGTLKIWQLDADGNRWVAGPRVPATERGSALSVHFHPSRDDMLIIAGEDGTAKIFEKRGDEWQVAISVGGGAGAGAVNQAIFSPPDANGMVEVITAGDDGNVKIWTLDGQLIRTLASGTSVQCVAVSPDRKWIVAGVASEAWVWAREAPQETPVQKLIGHSAGITSVGFEPSGTRLLTASRDFNVKLWDALDWKIEKNETDQSFSRELLTLEGHTDAVMSITVLPNETNPYVITAGSDGQAILWPSVNWN